MSRAQASLFPPVLPHGMTYRADFIDRDEERALLEHIRALPLREAQYRQYTARRRTVNYGFSYDFTHQKANAAPPIPEFLAPLRTRAAQWAGVAPEDFVQALIAEYAPGTPLGWHRDVPDFELIVGISLGGTRAHPLPAVSVETGTTQRGFRARARAALGVRPARRGALGLAAQHSADEGAALLGHVPHRAPEPELRGARRVEAAMNREFKERYAERGRKLQFMGFPIDDMETEELYAVIGFLLEQAGDDTELTLAQEAPLGAPLADPPKNDGLVEG